jgi:RNA-binding protein YhbY|tara:strand:+ start:30 stop:278 length:249 start_codon:yes stop_codon:yes gene_type:complete
MRKGLARFQIGKNGVTDGFRESLASAFKTRKIIKISVLKSVVRDKEKVKEMAEELISSMEGSYKYRIIGFTIVLRKSNKTQK